MASQKFQIPSICIPRVYIKYDDNYVARVFEQLFGDDNTGNSCIQRIDMKKREDKKTGEEYWMVFVHFSSEMEQTSEIEAFVERLDQGEQIKIAYRDHWYWKVSKNKSNRQAQRKGPRILSAEDEEDIKKFQKKQRENKPKNEELPTTPFEEETEN